MKRTKNDTTANERRSETINSMCDDERRKRPGIENGQQQHEMENINWFLKLINFY